MLAQSNLCTSWDPKFVAVVDRLQMLEVILLYKTITCNPTCWSLQVIGLQFSNMLYFWKYIQSYPCTTTILETKIISFVDRLSLFIGQVIEIQIETSKWWSLQAGSCYLGLAGNSGLTVLTLDWFESSNVSSFEHVDILLSWTI